MTDPGGPAVSALDEIRETLHVAKEQGFAEWDDAYLPSALYRHTASLLKVAEAALAFHEESGGSCGSCLDAYGDHIEWPCEEYRAITAALAGKEAGDGG